jgi:hypothetical protein
MAVQTTLVNKPLNPRGNDQSPLAYNRAKLFSGKALDFDGVNDYIDISTFSMSGQDGSFCFYYEQDANSVFRYAFDMIPTTGVRVAIVIDNGQLKFLINNEALANQGEILNGEPNFCVVTSEGTTQNFYINGQFIGSQTSATYISLATTGDAAIGSRRDGAAAFLDGQLSGFKIFNTALTAAQVADLYNNPEKVVPTGVNNTALKLWLPMQEGAGTTAYDGSGNGNHGTISGATYVHGIGAPVAQTAVIDWNKASNELEDSEDFATGWQQAAVTSLTDASITAPNGSDSVKKLVINSGSATFKGTNNDSTSLTPNADYSLSIFVKKETARYAGFRTRNTNQGLFFDFDTETIVIDYQTNNTANFEDYGNGWYKLNFIAQASGSGSVNFGIGFSIDEPTTLFDFEGDGTSGMYIWGAQLNAGSVAAYVPTFGIAQTSPVLLPQGLTTGRDITGVNLFENVRKQGALNLDGKSWAEVHDNASLDFGTGSFSIEAWVRVKYVNQGSSFNIVITLGGNVSNANTAGMLINASTEPLFMYNTNASIESSVNEGTWIHMVGVYNETNTTLYVNGIQEDQDTRTAADMTNTLVKQIGRDSSSVRYYNDQIAQPRIYNRALTASEVLNNYNATSSLYI